MVSKIKSADFLAGYVFKSLERNMLKDTDVLRAIPTHGYKNDVAIPKVWVCADRNATLYDFAKIMDPACKLIEEAHNATYGTHMSITTGWQEDDVHKQYLKVVYTVHSTRPRKMTIAEIEEQLGYKIEIISG